MLCANQIRCATLLCSSLLPKLSRTSGTGGSLLALAVVVEAGVVAPPEWTHFLPVRHQTALIIIMKDLQMDLLTHNP